MKKKLESELISIAHRILKLKGKEDVDRMHQEVSKLYEKLTVLKFAQENFEDQMPKIGNDSSFFGMLDTAFNNKVSDNIEVEDKVYVNLDESENDDIMEPVMEKIKDMVAQMPSESQQIDAILETKKPDNTSSAPKKIEDIPSSYANIPVFEPLEEAKKRQHPEKEMTLNDKLKTNRLNIGLNDKIAFIKHLFNNNSDDYNRVISQINTANSVEDAKHLIQQFVKPDYNNWEGKDVYEERFFQIIEDKFN